MFFAYYVVGLFLSVWFVYKGYGVMGLVIGGVVGIVMYVGIMICVVFCIDWLMEIARSKYIRGVSAFDDDDDFVFCFFVDVVVDDEFGNGVDVFI